MKLQSTYLSEPKVLLQLSGGSKVIRDYRLDYSYLGLSITGTFTTVFPRTGFLIFTMVTGKDLETRFMNYKRSVTRPNHLYISGLYSASSLLVNQTGTGAGYAMWVHPVVGYYLLKIPMHELLGRQIRICHILDDRGRFLEKVEADYKISSFDDPKVVQFFEEALPPKSAWQNDPIYHAVNFIISKRGIITVKDLAKQCCMCKQTMHRQFLLKVGLSPQAYAKIWQIQYAMHLIRHNPKVPLSKIAFQAGYYDVAHLAHDFKHRVSLAPSKLNQNINLLSQQYLDATTGPFK